MSGNSWHEKPEKTSTNIAIQNYTNTGLVSRIQILTSKITQVCQDIRDMKPRRLLVTRSDDKSNDITNNILTNQNDCKNNLGSSRSKPDPPDTHEDCAEGDINYVYRTPNHLELDTQNNQEDHGRCPPQPRSTPSEMTPEPPPYPDPSEASETSSSLLTSLSVRGTAWYSLATRGLVLGGGVGGGVGRMVHCNGYSDN